jgi:exopolysaccharide biosynthesis WecB/TagA/CpsF family protein
MMPPSEFMLGPIKCSTHTIADLLIELKELLHNQTLHPRTINCLNAHIYNLAWQDDNLRDLLNQSRIVAADGMSIVWAASLFGRTLPARCNMTEAFNAFLADASFPDTKAVLVGGTQEVAEQAAMAINDQHAHLTVVEAVSGYLNEQEYKHFFEAHGRVDFILLGLGTPKTEQIAAIIATIRPEAIIWHIGGGTILFLAGEMMEAPPWMRRMGLQWLHRLLLEPKRMWQRYILGNPLFLWRILTQRFGWLNLSKT